MKTFQVGIACAAMMAFLVALIGCGESGGKASLQTKTETPSADESEAAEEAQVAAEAQLSRSEVVQAEQTVATTDRPPAAESVEIPLDQIWA